MKFSEETVKKINHFILCNVERNPNCISDVTQSHFGISKQTAAKYIGALEKENLIKKTSKGRYPNYQLVNEVSEFRYKEIPSLSEEKILVHDIAPLISGMKKNIVRAFDYAVSEMVNNVIDHSQAEDMQITVTKNAAWTQILVEDNGIGIFNKIQRDLNLDDPQNAIIELAKGKFTSDSKHHSGEGIFFTSKICDDFAIVSENLIYKGDKLGSMLEKQNINMEGTRVFLKMYNDSKIDPSDIFDEYSDLEKTPSFYKTKVPVKMLESGDVILVSRSQAKRLVHGFEKFKEVILDFSDVSEIGQGFADELFRVWQNEHPDIKLLPINACERVVKMIGHVLG